MYVKIPTIKVLQQWPTDEYTASCIIDKLGKLLERSYTQQYFMEIITGFFAVLKSDDDIKVLYDATKCGLNYYLCDPKFDLPTIYDILYCSWGDTCFLTLIWVICYLIIPCIEI